MALRSSSGRRGTRSTGLTAAAAYRMDAEKRKGPPGEQEGSWIVIATIVGHIQHAVGPDRRKFLNDAAAMARELFDAHALEYGCAFDPPKVDRTSSIAVLRLLAERIEYGGLMNLAACLVEGLAGVLPADSLNSGRVLAHRARLTWKQGKFELATARYEHLLRKARRFQNTELAIRACAGFSSLAQIRGNYPRFRHWASLTVRHAERVGYTRLASLGHHGMMVASARAGEMDKAIAHGWAAFKGRHGDRMGQLSMLSNIGQLFLDAGHPRPAFEAFSRVLASKPDLHIGLPALGGYAQACAALGDGSAVQWAAAEACASSTAPGVQYESALVLLDCASALDAVGDLPYASVLRARGSTIAQYSGFHELTFRADTAVKSPTPMTVHSPRGAVAAELVRLPEPVLPDHLELAGVYGGQPSPLQT